MKQGISSFKDINKGETALLIGNGVNLKLTPPEWFDYPSFGMNTIHEYEGYKPSYYVAVDRRIMNEFGENVYSRFSDIPKFVSSPSLDKWNGENFYRFSVRSGYLYNKKESIWQDDLIRYGMIYANVMHVVIKLARYMGFTTLLIIGMQHNPKDMKSHFWGVDEGMGQPMLDDWLEGYRQLSEGMEQRGERLLNISLDTYVPENVIKRADWRQFARKEYVN